VTKSEKNYGAVVGVNQATADGPAWGVFGISQVGEGVHGETASQTASRGCWHRHRLPADSSVMLRLQETFV